MEQRNDFRAVEFFRKVRDEQAAMLVGKSHEEIMAFFSSFDKGSKLNEAPQRTLANARSAELDR